jgi:hypothetical protein
MTNAYLVPIVMDGENALESCENGGHCALYALLSGDSTLKP